MPDDDRHDHFGFDTNTNIRRPGKRCYGSYGYSLLRRNVGCADKYICCADTLLYRKRIKAEIQ